jgi:CubicO group peptidase (beta-lactamase class C family)
MKCMSASLLVLSSFLIAPQALAICDNPPCVRLPNPPKANDAEAVCEAKLTKEWQTSQPSLGYGSAGFSEVMDKAMSKLFSQPGVAHDQFPGGRWPGVTIAISQNDKLVFAKSYGFGDMQAPQLTHPDDLYRLASDSKQLTGVAILKLIHDGQSVDGNPNHKLTLDSKVYDILSSPPNAILPPGGLNAINPALKSITVEELMHHTGEWANNEGDPVWYFYQPNPVLPVTEDNVVKAMIIRPPTLLPSWQPGSIFSYSNWEYNLLARLITKVAGQDYETIVRQKVLEPVGITHTKVGHSLLPDRADQEVRYYTSPNTPPQPSLFPAQTGPTISGDENIPYGSWSLEAGRGAGGWIASSIDTLRFQLSVNGRGSTQVYPDVFADILTTHNQPSAACDETDVSSCGAFHLINPQNDRYNAGWGVHRWGAPYNGFDIDHGGGVNGGGSWSLSIPEGTNVHGYGIALVTNSTNMVKDFNLDGTVQQTLTDYLATHSGSILDPQWSQDTSFFDQYGDFAGYMSAAAMDLDISRANKKGCRLGRYNNSSPCYPSRLEGELQGGAEEYRAQFVPLHSGDKFDYALGAKCTAYVQKDHSLKAQGYQPVNLQWYSDAQGLMRFQGVWVKIQH